MDPRVLWSRIFKTATSFDIFENTKYYQNEPRFNGVYSRNNLHDKIKDDTCLINLDEYFDIGTHRIAFYALNNNFSYFLTVLELNTFQKKSKHLLINLQL